MESFSTPALHADELLETLLNVSLTGVIFFQPIYAGEGRSIIDLAYVRLNPAAQRMLQLPERPPLTFLTLYPHARETDIFAFYRDTYLSGKANRYNVHYTYDGLDNYFLLSAQPVGPLLVVSFTDTADYDRSAAEQALRESQAREKAARTQAELQRQQLHNLFMQVPALICLFEGPEHVFKLVNPPYQQLVGERHLLDKPIREAMPELEGQSIFGLLDQVYQTGESFYAYEQLVQIDHHNTGQIGQNYYNFIYQPLHSLSGQVEGIFVFAYQVTDLVEARKAVVTLNQELEVRVATRTQQLEAALQEKEWHRMQLLQQRGWLEYILGQVPASIATLAGPEHRYSFFNDHYQTFSANRTQIGLPVAEVFPEVVDQGFIGLLDQVYATGKSFVGKETPVLLYDLTSGKPELRYVDFIYQPLVDEQSQITGILVFVVDVSEKVEARQRVEESKQQALALAQERAAANQELAALNEELQAANEEILSTNEELGESNQQFLRTNIELERVNKDLDNFVYTASHDLRAPISNIEGLLKALEREIGKYQPQTDKVEHLYSMLNSSVNRFKQTIGDLTDVARISKESQEDVASISISEVLQEVILDLTSQIQEAQAELDVSIPDQQVHFSRKNLKSILYNLLSNAVKYRSLERAPFIRIMFRAEGGYIVLTVEDNGLGIDMSQKEKIFGLFKRLHAHVEGTGIGLYIVKRIVENAGGRIEVESQVGVGSTFKVFFKQWP